MILRLGAPFQHAQRSGRNRAGLRPVPRRREGTRARMDCQTPAFQTPALLNGGDRGPVRYITSRIRHFR